MTKWMLILALGVAALPGQTKAVKPIVRLIATGGTIAHVRPGFTPDTRITGHELLQSIPQLGQYAQIEVEEFSKIGSGDFSTTMLVALAKRINQIFANEPAYTRWWSPSAPTRLEEVALLPGPDGQERQACDPDSGPAAARNAGRRWRHESARCRPRRGRSANAAAWAFSGVVNDEIHAARDVRKNISHRVDAWNSGDLGDLGMVDKDRVSYYRRPIRKHTTESEFDVSGLTDLPKVYILYSYVGADAVLVDAAVKQGGAKGIVMAAFPTGTGAPEQADALLKVAATGIPVVDSQRGGRGRPANRYPEFVDGDNLTPQQARLLLTLALTKTTNKESNRKNLCQNTSCATGCVYSIVDTRPCVRICWGGARKPLHQGG